MVEFEDRDREKLEVPLENQGILPGSHENLGWMVPVVDQKIEELSDLPERDLYLLLDAANGAGRRSLLRQLRKLARERRKLASHSGTRATTAIAVGVPIGFVFVAAGMGAAFSFGLTAGAALALGSGVIAIFAGMTAHQSHRGMEADHLARSQELEDVIEDHNP